MADSILPFTLDELLDSTATGSLNRAIGNNLYGLNPLQTKGVVPANRELQGYTFFVRPQLNMQVDNIRNLRKLSGLLSSNAFSVQRFVRTMLDPRMVAGYRFRGGRVVVPELASPLLDNEQAFIGVYTNNMVSLSGWPDMVVPTYTSPSGLYNEVYTQVDGVTVNYENYTLDATFRNTINDPILYLNHCWCTYMSAVFEGTLMPYMDFIADNRIDYNTRIYRLIVSPNRKKVTKLACCGVAFPVSNPVGSFFDVDSSTPYTEQNKQFTIRFSCLGFELFDDILIEEFNKTVQMFNPSMKDGARDQAMVKIDEELYNLFKYRVYPRINPINSDLEWWVRRHIYDSKAELFFALNAEPEMPSASQGSSDNPSSIIV